MENYLFYDVITVNIYSFDYGFYHINVINSYLPIFYADYENGKKKTLF
jgi:hypothetical protein